MTDVDVPYFLAYSLTGILPQGFGAIRTLNTLDLLGNNYTVRLPDQNAPVFGRDEMSKGFGV